MKNWSSCGDATLTKEFTKLRADLAEVRTILNAHVHSGVTAGAANTAVSTTTAAALTSDDVQLKVA